MAYPGTLDNLKDDWVIGDTYTADDQDEIAAAVNALESRVGVTDSPGWASLTNAWASPPSSPETGARWLPPDALYEAYWDGSAWQYRFEGKPAEPPSSARFSITTIVGTATVDGAHGGLHILGATDSSQLCGVLKTLDASSNYRAVCGFDPFMFNGAGYTAFMMLRDSSGGKIKVWGWDGNLGLLAQLFNSASSFSGTYTTPVVPSIRPRYLALHDNGTNLLFEYSQGTRYGPWRTFFSHTRTTDFTADQVGIGVRSVDSTNNVAAFFFDFFEET